MKRKLVKQGGTALTITLPSEWCKKYGLKSGDELEIQERGASVIINTRKGIEVEKKEIDATKVGPIIHQIISRYYKEGVDEIKIIYKDSQTVANVQKRLQQLLGYEIVEHGKNFLIVKCLTTELEKEFENALSRGFLVALNLADSSLSLVKEGNLNKLKEILYLETINDKFMSLCQRCLMKYGYKDVEQIPFLFYFIDRLNKVTNQYTYMIEYFLENNKKRFNKETIALYEEVNQSFHSLHHLFYKFNMERLADFYISQKNLIKKIQQSLPKLKKDEIVLHFFITIAQEIRRLSELLIR